MSTQVELEGMLRDALPRQELFLAYQPILPLTGGQAVGIEALVRWRPQRGDAATSDDAAATFLPPAEDSELIVQIGRWVLHTALRAGRALAARRDRRPDLRQRLRPRADRARPRRADPRGARLLPPAGTRAVHRGQRGVGQARPRARARGAARRQAPRRARSRSTNSAPASSRSASRATCPWTSSSSTAG